VNGCVKKRLATFCLILLGIGNAYVPHAFAQNAPLSISPALSPAKTEDAKGNSKPKSAPSKATAKATPKNSSKAFPLPPLRPTDLGEGAIVNHSVSEKISPAAPPKTLEDKTHENPPSKDESRKAPKTEKEAIDLLNRYFNSFTYLSGDFIQFGGDGRRVEGQFLLHKPGRLRFDYKPPSRLEVIADGQSVAVRDKRLNTQDLYALSQTPLKFLLNARIDLSKDMRLKNVSITSDLVRATLEDKSTLGGSSEITLQYDLKTNALSQWTVIDPQGLETSVSVYNLNTTRKPDPARFVINQERTLEDRK
jgi:outer membrane lipoprotein-sorting protein